jgi:hypothetical protein
LEKEKAGAEALGAVMNISKSISNCQQLLSWCKQQVELHSFLLRAAPRETVRGKKTPKFNYIFKGTLDLPPLN